MENYTLEEVLDAINSELTDAYYEASKEYKLAKKMAKDELKSERLITKGDIAELKGKQNKFERLYKKNNKLVDKFKQKYDADKLDSVKDLTPEEKDKLEQYCLKKSKKWVKDMGKVANLKNLKKEAVYDILEAYEYDVISYEDANEYLDMLALFED